jgi:hypothetical protein
MEALTLQLDEQSRASVPSSTLAVKSLDGPAQLRLVVRNAAVSFPAATSPRIEAALRDFHPEAEVAHWKVHLLAVDELVPHDRRFAEKVRENSIGQRNTHQPDLIGRRDDQEDETKLEFSRAS